MSPTAHRSKRSCCILKDTALSHPNVLKDKEVEPVVRFADFGESSLTFKTFIWIDDLDNRYKVPSDFRIGDRAPVPGRGHRHTVPAAGGPLHRRDGPGEEPERSERTSDQA